MINMKGEVNLTANSQCAPPPPPPPPAVLLAGGEEAGLNLHPNFQKGGGLDRTSSFRGGCWERGG